MRLGFPGRLYGTPAGPSPAGAPVVSHLSVGLVRLHDILHYLGTRAIQMYRVDVGLLPAGSEPSGFDALAECAGELALVGETARSAGVRLSFHPRASVVVNTPDASHAAYARATLTYLARLLDAMALGPHAVIVVHVGGVWNDSARGRERFVIAYEALPAEVRRRLVLENDDRRYDQADVQRIHAACGVPLVYDHLHHLVLNREGLPAHEALAAAVRTWPAGVTPKVHYSTPRTEARGLGTLNRLRVPSWTEHSDFIDPFAFADFVRATTDLGDLDVMLEAKARDLALLKLRADLTRYAPDVAARCIGQAPPTL